MLFKALGVVPMICSTKSKMKGVIEMKLTNKVKANLTAAYMAGCIALSAATTANADETTTTDAVTTTDSGETTTTAEGETTTAAGEAAETTAANAAAATEAPAAATESPTEAPAQQQEQPQQNNDAPADNGSNNTQPDAQEVKFSTDDLLKNAADIISALGGSPITSTSPSCTSNGCDVKTYDYAGELKIQCYIDGGVEYFFDYDILGGNYSTSKGIKVGSSRADVEAAYGAGEASGNMLIYNDGAKQLIFTLNGDTVSEIDFYVPV